MSLLLTCIFSAGPVRSSRPKAAGKVTEYQAVDLTFPGCPTLSFTLFRSDATPLFPATDGKSVVGPVLLESVQDRLVIRFGGKAERVATIQDRIAFGHELLMVSVFAEPAEHYDAGERGGVLRPGGFRQRCNILDQSDNFTGIHVFRYVEGEGVSAPDVGLYRARASFYIRRGRNADGSPGLARPAIRLDDFVLARGEAA